MLIYLLSCVTWSSFDDHVDQIDAVSSAAYLLPFTFILEVHIANYLFSGEYFRFLLIQLIDFYVKSGCWGSLRFLAILSRSYGA